MSRTMNRLEARESERGSALLLALMLIIILTLVGVGLLTRSLLVTEIAGSERWSTAAFYAADSGIDVAKNRLRVNRLEAFSFDLKDLRGATGVVDAGNIQVAVDDLQQVGPPRLAPLTQSASLQGSESEQLFVYFFRARSTALNQSTRSQRVVSAVMNVGPVPALPPSLPALSP